MCSPTTRYRKSIHSVLSVIGGSTDTIGFLGLNGLFTSHVTGNLVILTAHLAAGEKMTWASILAMPVFMLVVFLTRLLAVALHRAGIAVLKPLLLLQLLWLLAFLVLSVADGPWLSTDAVPAVVAGMFGVAAMAVQNALVQIALGDTPATAVMTTNVARFMLDVAGILDGQNAAEVAKAGRRATRTVPVLFGFVLGCGLGATLESAAGLWSLVLPAGLGLLAFGIAVTEDPRSRVASRHAGASGSALRHVSSEAVRPRSDKTLFWD